MSHMQFKDILNTRSLLTDPITQQCWPNLQKIISHLQGYLSQCIKQREYLSAQHTKQRIEQYKKQTKLRSLSTVENRLQQALKQLDYKHSQQFQSFQVQFKLKHNNLIQQHNDLLHKKLTKQQQQKQRYFIQLNQALPLYPATDNQLHKLKWQQDQYVKSNNFIQANKIKEKIKYKQNLLIERHQKYRENNINQMMNQLQEKCNHQINIIENRIKEKLLELQNQQNKKRKQIQMKQAKQIKQLKWIFNQQMKKVQLQQHQN